MQICSKKPRVSFQKIRSKPQFHNQALLDLYEPFYIQDGILLHALAIFIVVPKKRARHLGLI